jgi:hypothetical protein
MAGRGRPFIKTVTEITPDLQPGQWVKLPDWKKSARFAGYLDGVPTYVPPSRKDNKGVVTNIAFRLAVGKSRRLVVPKRRVKTSG